MGVTSLAQPIDRSADRKKNLRDANLVNLFIRYLSSTERLTEEDTESFKRFDICVSYMALDTASWNCVIDNGTPTNRLFYPPDPDAKYAENCPGPRCCSTGLDDCTCWYHVVAFI